ncbi:Release factor glutamine methyltransferase [Pannonibacter phragmitetus]|uniref:Release factor glutamine methyltransferase n=1 Tax=Pannonibacter phragmitetus TaxID=121719 RepID=A0A379A042_9HYPH|nr:peptide chain release factor N(5)-glutamine methyltransferase [Pannonibacter phragmitetus]SUB02747.1 Release factor glutamine methyltransferase [Pannonibacter phragmitetus]
MSEAGEVPTLGALYRELRDRFRKAGLASPELDARLLVAAAAVLSPGDVVLRTDDPVSGAVAALARRHAQRREAREPVGRILGERQFFGLDLALSPDTLEPRPDTETLVEVMLARAGGFSSPLIADIGTGTGAIILALLSELPQARGLAIDLSRGALETARANARRHGLEDRLCFAQASYAGSLAPTFDWIVSNPPYIVSDVIAGLDEDVRKHDPVLALDGGHDGLVAYRAIVPQALPALRPGGRLGLEIGFDQGGAVCGLMAEAGFKDIEIIQDLGGNDRVVTGIKPVSG